MNYVDALNNLKTAYLNKKIENTFGRTLELEGQYVNLQILHYNDIKEEKEKSKGSVEASYKEARPSSFEDLFEDKRAIKPEDLFKPDQALFSEELLKDKRKAEISPCFLLIQGRAGIGKTTFVRYVTREWAAGKLYQEYEWIFTLTFRELRSSLFKKFLERGESLNLCKWVYYAQFSSQPWEKQFNIFWQETIEPAIHQKKVLLILDGYDELPEEHPCIKTLESLLTGEYAKCPKIITSRPYGVSQLPLERRDLEVIGFTDANIRQYISKYFPDKALATSLQTFLSQNAILWATCHIPLHLYLICWIAEKTKLTELKQLQTMTSLYTAIDEKLWERYHQERGSKTLPESPSRRTEFLRKEYDTERRFLGELAFKEMASDQRGLLSRASIDELLDKYEIQDDRVFMTVLRGSGLIKPVVENSVIAENERDYEFLHLTFQEYYAAFYISIVLQQTNGRDDIEDFILKNKFNPRWQIVWWFVGGLLKVYPFALESYLSLIKDTETRDLIGDYSLALEVRIIEESYDKTTLMVQQVQNLLQQFFLESYQQYQQGYFSRSALIMLLRFNSQLMQGVDQKDLAFLLPLNKEHDQNEMLEFLREFGLTTPSILKYLKASLQDKNICLNVVGTVRALGQAAATPEMLQGLLALLRDEDSTVRSSAVRVVRALRQAAATPEMLQGLLVLLRDENSTVRSSAVRVVRALRQAAATSEMLQGLLVLLRDENSIVRSSAVSAVGTLGEAAATPEILQVLPALLRDANPSVCSHAVRVVQALGQAAATSDILQALVVLLKEKKYIGFRAVVFLLQNLSQHHFINSLEIWLNASKEAVTLANLDLLLSVAILGCLNGYVQIQVFSDSRSVYQCYVYIGKESFQFDLNLHQAVCLRYLMPQIMSHWKKTGELFSEEKLLEMFQKIQAENPLKEQEIMFSCTIPADSQQDDQQAVVKYEFGKIVLTEDKSLSGILEHAAQQLARMSLLDWIDKRSPEQLLLRKIVDGSTTKSIQDTLTENAVFKSNADLYGNLASHWVAIVGRSDLVPLLKQQIFPVKKFNQFGLAPWHMAAAFNQTSTLAALVDQFGEANYKCKKNYKSLSGQNYSIELSPFHIAILFGREEVVNWYLKRDNFEVQVNNFGNIFHLAVCGGQTTVFNLLLNHPNPKLQQNQLFLLEQSHLVENLSVLSYAAAKNQYWIVHELLTHYQRTSAKEYNRHEQDQVALKEAVRYGTLESVRMLVSMDVKVDFSFLAAENDEEEITLKTFAQRFKKKDPSPRRGDIFNYLDAAVGGYRENKNKILEVNQRRVRNLVFQGGGIKGLAHVGAYQALCYSLPKQSYNPQAIEGIERVAGTSAGAITAMAVALGFTPVQLNQLMQDAPFERFLDDIKPEVLKNEGFWNTLSGLFQNVVNACDQLAAFAVNPVFYSVDLLKSKGLSKGEIIMGWLSKVLAEHLIAISQEKSNSQLSEVINGIHDLKKSSEVDLADVIKNGLKEEQLLKLTFGQLKELVILDNKRFKHLYTVALRLNNPDDSSIKEGIEVMHAEGGWDQVLIIDAIRASMSIPIFFIPHQVRQCNQHGMLSPYSQNHYIDGGLLKNYPIELFDKFKYLPEFSHGDADKPEPNPFTIGFRLVNPEETARKEAVSILGYLKESLGKITQSMQKGIERETAIGVLQSLSSLYYNAEDIIAEFQNTRVGRTIQISNAGISTLKFELNIEEKNTLIRNGEKSVCEAYGIDHEEYKKTQSPMTPLYDRKRKQREESPSEDQQGFTQRPRSGSAGESSEGK